MAAAPVIAGASIGGAILFTNRQTPLALVGSNSET